MNLLLDTHLLLWAAAEPERLSRQARSLITDSANVLIYSVASLWEVAIKHALRRRQFAIDPRILHRGLRERGYRELPVNADHAIGVAELPPLHRDPFDRLLIAQATVEGIMLLTSDSVVARYPGQIRKV